MKHRHKHAGGRNRQVFSPEGTAGSGGKHRHQHGRGGGRRGGRSRLFDYGEIRLLVLKMISEKPTYGYELIKDIEEKFGGSYTPSPGVIYPTLTWLEEAGYIRSADGESRKNYQITPEGEAFLSANRVGLEEILSRTAAAEPEGRGGRKNIPMPVMRGMENLKTALRLRLRNGGLDLAAEEKIAALLDEAARGIGQV
ncbi:PadR family transcriptional regulator [Acetobacter pasteurianus]|uniref:Transcriptional regulator PadR n=2 Tax=Acetobacter pasteurianus TaxID=438 RepID=C7JI60_ACEP3|nr:PadR family transcriptional regulator [Acetobacter pasteurianus]ASC06744.1 Transcriptional regulator YqjI [Acetobacter pasteurianus subsp. pasteurianus]BAI17886.1 transcriptional regulator PadR [Acetobacter pasteurianus IFO 3283-01-42C]BAH99664.1 transcriptional regulator PadR [Acetobacter pasteurianus IFO 3283-01]BAI02717.1 transcriptional regulator PadR [Acetobacter pasteurianus IFO 3283-03]BAI05763.1 transcriptional regulator PadR [Acetobacter pasteurianus IFO 3283-07]